MAPWSASDLSRSPAQSWEALSRSLRNFCGNPCEQTRYLKKIRRSFLTPKLRRLHSLDEKLVTTTSSDPLPITDVAWELLRRSVTTVDGTRTGLSASPEVFVRDFVPSALASLMNGEPEIVRNFILKTVHLQSRAKKVDSIHIREGAFPASFKVLDDPLKYLESLEADFGDRAYGTVAPVDSGLWWIILLRAYTKATGDFSLVELPECQKEMRRILNDCLSEGCDTFPKLPCGDGCGMIDQRMGVHGYPIEIQALFAMALKSALQLLKRDDDGNELIKRIIKRVSKLSLHIRKHHWFDLTEVSSIYRYKAEVHSNTATSRFSVIPDSLPEWILDFMPTSGGYFVGKVSPARKDFRWFCLGNCIAIISSLATPEQTKAIMDLIESRWEELVGEMPMKICYPAMENHEWRVVTRCNPRTSRWSQHNGGSWPVLLWAVTAACLMAGRPHLARKMVAQAELRLAKDSWPEYYDGKKGQLIGKRARINHTWSEAGYLAAKLMLEDPTRLGILSHEEDRPLVKRATIRRSTSLPCSL